MRHLGNDFPDFLPVEEVNRQSGELLFRWLWLYNGETLQSSRLVWSDKTWAGPPGPTGMPSFFRTTKAKKILHSPKVEATEMLFNRFHGLRPVFSIDSGWVATRFLVVGFELAKLAYSSNSSKLDVRITNLAAHPLHVAQAKRPGA